MKNLNQKLAKEYKARIYTIKIQHRKAEENCIQISFNL